MPHAASANRVLAPLSQLQRWCWGATREALLEITPCHDRPRPATATTQPLLPFDDLSQPRQPPLCDAAPRPRLRLPCTPTQPLRPLSPPPPPTTATMANDEYDVSPLQVTEPWIYWLTRAVL